MHIAPCGKTLLLTQSVPLLRWSISRMELRLCSPGATTTSSSETHWWPPMAAIMRTYIARLPTVAAALEWCPQAKSLIEWVDIRFSGLPDARDPSQLLRRLTEGSICILDRGVSVMSEAFHCRC